MQTRRLKRKCNRELPSCGLCLRLGKPCGYPLKQQQDTADDTDFLLQKIQQLEHRLEVAQSGTAAGVVGVLTPSSASRASLLSGDPSNRLLAATGLVSFPKAIVLDTDLFTPLPRPGMHGNIAWNTPREVVDVLGFDVEAICEKYFASAYKWFSMLSRKRLAQSLARSSSSEWHPAVALLLLCMKLLTEPLQAHDAPEMPLYQLTRQYLSAIENAGSINLLLVQAIILTAIYELGHAIHPAAYLSISRAARIGHLLGLHDKDHATQMFETPETWTLCEEERRTWWAVVILDRYVQCGMTGVPLATCEPLQGELLPCNDNDWSQGLVGSNDPLFTASPSLATPGISFATLCRSSHMLGRVLRHKSDHILEFPDKLAEAFQLHRALQSLERSFTCEATREELKTCDLPRAVVCTARFILYNIYACNERYSAYKLGQETDMQKIAVEGLSTAALTVAQIAQRFEQDYEMGVRGHPPLLAHCMYQALGECAWFVREDPSPQMQCAFDTIATALKCMAHQWRVCGE
ncbi:fungal specific transcription factor [Cladophialophora carrionii]|uniref:Fungal specific transcription factor n=1 Tax=Cladophialophora carrionii TaxID=86049 RepID=A0A1C1CI23_9EURO|nr:fungal specific transcription factor [Cladophialophora carrionii]